MKIEVFSKYFSDWICFAQTSQFWDSPAFLLIVIICSVSLLCDISLDKCPWHGRFTRFTLQKDFGSFQLGTITNGVAMHMPAHTLLCINTWISVGYIQHWGRKGPRTPVFTPGKSHGQRSLAGYSPRGRSESDTTEDAHICSIIFETSRTPCMISHHSANQIQGPFSGHVSQVAWFFISFTFAFDICLHSLKGSTLDSEDVFYPNNILPNHLHLCSTLPENLPAPTLPQTHFSSHFTSMTHSLWLNTCRVYPFLSSGNSWNLFVSTSESSSPLDLRTHYDILWNSSDKLQLIPFIL